MAMERMGKADESSALSGSGLSEVTLKWIGLGVIVAAAILSNLGVNVQKLSHLREEQRPLFKRRIYYSRPLWILGFVLILLGSIGDFEALAFAPQALVASVGGGCTVLANVLIAHLWLGESLSKSDVFGTLLIMAGVVLSSIINEPDKQLHVDQLKAQFGRKEFLVYVSIAGIFLLILFWEIRNITSLATIPYTRKYSQRLPYLYAIASGIIGSFSVLLAKCASMTLFVTFQGENQFIFATTYFFIGGMIVAMILQTDLLNRAIMVGDTLSVFPVFQCFWIGGGVCGGVVFYQKFLDFSIYEWVALPLALLLILHGIYLLSQHEMSLPADMRTKSRFSISGSLVPLSPSIRSVDGSLSFPGYGSMSSVDFTERS